MTEENILIPIEYAKQRLDQVLAQLLPQYSRSFLQTAIKQGHILLNDKVVAPKQLVHGEELLSIHLLEPMHTEQYLPEKIDFPIVYEDADLLVINKPVGLVVHPGPGNWTGTLLNGLLHHNPACAQLPRAGIVHRLDKDTSGLLVVAKSREVHHQLVKHLQHHDIERTYDALVYGQITAGGTINAAIGRDTHDRLKMALATDGKPAVTHYRIAKRLGQFTLLRVQLETGRTHQIRVHLASIRHPIVGDQQYGKGLRLPKQASEALVTALSAYKHQALHAGGLRFLHPITQAPLSFTAEVPADYATLIRLLAEQ